MTAEFVKRGSGREVLASLALVEELLDEYDMFASAPIPRLRELTTVDGRRGRVFDTKCLALRRNGRLTARRFLELYVATYGGEFYPGFLDHPAVCLVDPEAAEVFA